MNATITMKVLVCLLWIVPAVSFTAGQNPTRRHHSRQITEDKHNRQPDSSRSYANLADPPISRGSSKPSFHSRMRDLVLNNPSVKKNKRNPSSSSHKSSEQALPVHRVTSLEDYKRLVVDQGKLSVVLFSADYCRSCRAVKPCFYRLAQNNPHVQWVEVPVTSETATIHKGLQVPSVPFGHVYHPEQGLVEEVRLRKEFFKDFTQILQSYQEGECGLPEEPNPETGLYDASYKRHT